MVAGVPISFGGRGCSRTAPPADSELVRRWKAAGWSSQARPTLRVWLHAVDGTGTRSVRRTTPTTSTRTAGGSSGGSGVAVAARLVPVVSGGDGGGSIRVGAGQRRLRSQADARPNAGRPALLRGSWEGAPSSIALTPFRARQRGRCSTPPPAPTSARPMPAPPQERPFLPGGRRTPGKLRIAFTTQVLIGVDDPPPDPECAARTRR